jgi:tRNA/rRNA methyltransferase
MLDNLRVVLVRTKYPENIGMAARACANMGCSDLVLVDPLYLDLDKALPLATAHARHILESVRVTLGLAEALADAHVVFGTTARTGGWRKSLVPPVEAGRMAAAELAKGKRVAFVFGSEDKGLENEEIQLCGQLVTIPTAREMSSLNLAQAVLVLLYECFRQSRPADHAAHDQLAERHATHAEQEALMANIQETLSAIDFLKPQNPDYWLLPVRRFFTKLDLRRSEFDMLMGICRQVRWIAGRAGKSTSDKNRQGER